MALDPTKQEQSAKTLTPIFFLIDTSGSMQGQSIDAVNAAMREAIPVVQEFALDEPDVAIRYYVLDFNTSANWMSEDPGNVEDFGWSDLRADGLTSLGLAYQKLNAKLSRKGGFLQEHGNNAPILILLTDGAPTDDAESGLALLKENKWFKASCRIAFKLPGANISTLKDFTGSEESVIEVSPDKLKDLLKVVAINSAVIGSKSQGRSTGNVTVDIIKDVKPEVSETKLEQDTSSTQGTGDEEDPFSKIFDD